MQGKGRKLGWIAIGLGVLALIVMFGGHMHQMMFRQDASAYWTGAYGYQTAPGNSYPGGYPNMQGPMMNPNQNQADPRMQGPMMNPNQNQADPRMQGPMMNNRQRGGNYQMPPYAAMPNYYPQSRGGFTSFLFLPFMLIGGIARSLLFLLLIFLAVRFFRKRHAAAQASPEATYTGETEGF